jgi:hypothetical protein
MDKSIRIHPFIHALSCQIRAIRDHSINPSSRLTLAEMAAIEGALVEAARRLRKARRVWLTYNHDPRNGTVFVQRVAVSDDGHPPFEWSFDVMHESASGDSFGAISCHETRDEAEAAARKEAIDRNCFYEPTAASDANSTFPNGDAA